MEMQFPKNEKLNTIKSMMSLNYIHREHMLGLVSSNMVHKNLSTIKTRTFRGNTLLFSRTITISIHCKSKDKETV